MCSASGPMPHPPVSKPLVSIVIPSLNSAAYYRECIESACQQDLDAIEIICVDAGSTDGTRGIIAEYADVDARVRLIESDMRSYGHQMNLGMDDALGTYLMILESDDIIPSHACSAYYRIAHENDLDFVKSHHCTFYGDPSNRTFKTSYITRYSSYFTGLYDPSSDPTLLLMGMLTQPGIYGLSFLRKEGIRWHETPGASFQDNGFWFQTFALGKRVMFLDEALYMLRRDNPNSSVASGGKVYDECEEFVFIRNFLIERGLKEFLPMCAFRRYGNYMFTVKRISDWFRPDFFARFAEDFRMLEEAGELDRKLFAPRDWDTLQQIMREGSDFYQRGWVNRERLIQSEEALKRQRRRYKSVVESNSYKVGRSLSLPIRVVKRLAKGAPLSSRERTSKEASVRDPYDTPYNQYLSRLSSEEYQLQLPSLVSHSYLQKKGGIPSLENPETFNEKLLFRKIHDRIQDTTRIVCDAWRSREWAAERIGWESLPKAWGPWEKFEDIEFDALPHGFMLRCNHGPHMYYGVEDAGKVDRDYLKQLFGAWIAGNPAYTEELRTEYREVPPCIFAEELPLDCESQYVLWCFDGKARLVQPVGSHMFYDTSWRQQRFSAGAPETGRIDVRPAQLEELVRVAECLSAGVEFLCVTLGSMHENRIVLRSLEVSPGGGYMEWKPAVADYWIGELWQLEETTPPSRSICK